MHSITLPRMFGAGCLLLMSGFASAGGSGHHNPLGHSHHHTGAHCAHPAHRVTIISNPYHSRRIHNHHQSSHHGYQHNNHHSTHYGHDFRRSTIRPSYYGRSSYGYQTRYSHGGGYSISPFRYRYGLSLYSRY